MSAAWRKTRQAAYKARKPWIRLLEFARRRCNDTNPKSHNFAHYAGKGIKCDLTGTELEAVWQRDKAYLLKRPSLDRIDSAGHYTAFNVRIIEYMKNVRMPHDKALADEVTPEFT